MNSSWTAAGVLASMALAALLAACPAGETPDPNGPPPSEMPVVTSAQGDDKSRLNNLIGRWYPSSEVTRLKDETITPEEWCRRPPVRLTIMADSVEMVCSVNDVHTAPLARVKTSTNAGEVLLTLRVGKESALRQIKFEGIAGPRAKISGAPCAGYESVPFERFPEFESLTRQILSGRRCTQFDVATEATGTLSP